MRFVFSVLLVVVSFGGYAQIYTGFEQDNWAGVGGVNFQPASMVHTPYRFDFTLLSTGAYVTNNYFGLGRTRRMLFQNQEGKVLKANGLKTMRGFGDVDVTTFAFMMRPKAKNKFGIAVVPRIRATSSVKGVDGKFVDLLDDGFELKVGDRVEFKEAGKFAAASWAELNLMIAFMLKETPDYRVSLGAGVKILKSFSGAYVNIDELAFVSDIANGEYASRLSGEYGLSDNLSDQSKAGDFFNSKGGLSLGMDIGVRYERPLKVNSCIPYQKIAKRIFKPRVASYKYRLDFVLRDLGSVSFKAADGNARVLGLKNGVPLTKLDLKNTFKSVDDVRELTDALSPIFTVKEVGSGFAVSLPTVLSISGDLNLMDGFYLHGGISLDASFLPLADYRVISPTRFDLVPRWESMMFGVYMPVSYSMVNDFMLGLGFRAGPVFMGVRDLTSIVGSRVMAGQGFYFGLKHFITPKKKRDRSVKCSVFGVNKGLNKRR